MTTCNIQNFTNVSGTTKNITFLAPNTLYSFKFTPVNSAGSFNIPGVSKLFSATLANITSLNSQHNYLFNNKSFKKYSFTLNLMIS